MPKPSPYPHHPVRVLRTLLGFKSADAFAKFTGIPAETIRNLEQGRRAVTERVAKQIGIATGVFPGWLRTGQVARGEPIDAFGNQLTKETFESFSGIQARLKSDPNDGDEADRIDQFCENATALLRAAARKGRLPQCDYFLTMAVRDAAKKFRLEKAKHEETTRELDKRFRPSIKFGEEGDLHFGNYYAAFRLLSPTAQFRWNAELEAGEDQESSVLLDEIANLQQVVEASFEIDAKQRPSKRSSAQSQRRRV
jgi:transcriptional regulator with XRE-family HTH domain